MPAMPWRLAPDCTRRWSWPLSMPCIMPRPARVRHGRVIVSRPEPNSRSSGAVLRGDHPQNGGRFYRRSSVPPVSRFASFLQGPAASTHARVTCSLRAPASVPIAQPYVHLVRFVCIAERTHTWALRLSGAYDGPRQARMHRNARTIACSSPSWTPRAACSEQRQKPRRLSVPWILPSLASVWRLGRRARVDVRGTTWPARWTGSHRVSRCRKRLPDSRVGTRSRVHPRDSKHQRFRAHQPSGTRDSVPAALAGILSLL
jgi:hypothetical protein